MNDLFPTLDTHDPGGRRLALPHGVTATATYGGHADCYRYELEWVWDASLPALLFVGMNPSTATEHNGDATVRKMHKWARDWGWGRLLVGNTFAYRATDQLMLNAVVDPIGPGNDARVLAMAERAALVLLGYGTPHIRALHSRGPVLTGKLRSAGHGPKLHVLRLSEDGRPVHPLYLPAACRPFLMPEI